MQLLTDEEQSSLSRCTLFRGLNAAELLPRLNGTITDCPAGQFWTNEGDVIDRVAVLLTGTLHAACFERNGREFLYQQILPSYLVGGEIVCTPKKTCPYGIYAASDSRIWSFPWSYLTEDAPLPTALQLHLLQNLLSFVANQNIRKYYKIDALSVKSARERILKYLTAQAKRTGTNDLILHMDREDMANYLCLNRSVLSHELKQMEADGLIRFHKNHFVLLEKSCLPNLQA